MAGVELAATHTAPYDAPVCRIPAVISRLVQIELLLFSVFTCILYHPLSGMMFILAGICFRLSDCLFVCHTIYSKILNKESSALVCKYIFQKETLISYI